MKYSVKEITGVQEKGYMILKFTFDNGERAICRSLQELMILLNRVKRTSEVDEECGKHHLSMSLGKSGDQPEFIKV